MEADDADITARLARLDARERPTRVRARLLRPRPSGGTRPWDCQVEDGSWFIVKCQNNDQDRRQGPPLKVLSTELICGRLGRLFEPPLCPEAVIVDVPEDVAAVAVHPRTRRRAEERAAPGPSFGSRRVDGAVEIKQDRGQRLARASLSEVARIAVYQTWLRGVDVSALVTVDGDLLSIDHGYYLTTHRWDPRRLDRPLPVKMKLPSQIPDPARLADPALYVRPLRELCSLSEDRILQAFCGIPGEWEVPLSLRAQAAAYVLRRRLGVEKAVANFCRRHGRPYR